MSRLLAVFAASGILAGGAFGGVVLADDRSEPAEFDGTRIAVEYGQCPGGPTTEVLHEWDRVVLTGRSESGDYVELRDPGLLTARVWVPVETVRPDQELDGLPVRDCDDLVTPVRAEDGSEEVAAADTTTTTGVTETTATTADPVDSTTSTANSVPSTSPTSPPPLPTTSVAPNVAPTISNLTVSARDIWESCPDEASRPATSAVSAQVTDPEGAVSVTLEIRFGSPTGPLTTRSMSPSGAKFTGTVGPYPFGDNDGVPINATATLYLRLVATDSDGAQKTASAGTIVLHDNFLTCAN